VARQTVVLDVTRNAGLQALTGRLAMPAEELGHLVVVPRVMAPSATRPACWWQAWQKPAVLWQLAQDTSRV